MIHFTRGVRVLLFLSFSFFLIQQLGDRFLGTHLWNFFALAPYRFHSFWQIFTSTFLARDAFELVFQGLLLAMVGGELERIWGTTRFLTYYVFCMVSLAPWYWTLAAQWGLHESWAGSTGPLYALLLAYGWLLGDRPVFFMFLFPFKARQFVWVLAGFELLTSLSSMGHRGLSSLMALGGMFVGFLYFVFWACWRRCVLPRQSSLFKFFRFLGPVQSRTGSQRASGIPRGRASHLKLVRSFGEDPSETRHWPDDSNPKTWH